MAEIQDTIREIKSKFRLFMNGMVSQSMREKGIDYKLNFGIEYPRIKEIAADYPCSHELAQALWKENIRECKILATLIMPPADMKADLACLWVSQIPNQEVAAMVAFNLFQYIDSAKDLAFKWLASASELEQMCGYNILSRLFMRGEVLDSREINELFDQAKTALEGGSVSLQHTVVNMLSHFCTISDEYNKITKSAFKSYDLDIF